MTSSRGFRALLVLFAVAIGAVIGIGAFAMSSTDETLRGVAADPPRDVSTARLTDVDGQEVDFTPAAGEVNLTFFGFTHCPDICPTTLSDVRTALSNLGSKADRVKVSMVSVDPERDTAAALGDYVGRFFDKDTGSGVRTDDAQRLTDVAKTFGASYEVKPPAASGGDPEVVHTAWLYAVDDTGHIAAQWSFGTPPKDIEHDLRILLS
jgi:protein SCO1/2